MAVASTASFAPSGEVSSKHGVVGYGIVGGPNGNAVAPAAKSTVVETTVERVIFDFWFLALLPTAREPLHRRDRLNDQLRCGPPATPYPLALS